MAFKPNDLTLVAAIYEPIPPPIIMTKPINKTAIIPPIPIAKFLPFFILSVSKISTYVDKNYILYKNKPVEYQPA